MDKPLSGPNALAPDRMTTKERLAEVGQLLAAGMARLLSRDIRLDFPVEQRGRVHEPRSWSDQR